MFKKNIKDHVNKEEKKKTLTFRSPLKNLKGVKLLIISDHLVEWDY